MAELRRERGMTQDVFAQRLQVSTKYIQRLEQGSENLTLRTLASSPLIFSRGRIDTAIAHG